MWSIGISTPNKDFPNEYLLTYLLGKF